MPSTVCLRCFARAVHRVELPPLNAAQRTAFSTTTSHSLPAKKAVVAKPGARQGRTLRLTKNVRSNTGRPPDSGERKALRKRVVLSNSNAVEIAGLQDLTVETTSAERLRELHGTVIGLSNSTVDSLRALEGFKPTQGWNLFWRPASLVTKDTIEIAADLASVSNAKEKQTVRKVLCGEKGSGKSVLQLQSLAMALLQGWIVIHVPEAKDLTNAHTSYQPIETEQGTQYIQPHFTAKLLENIGKANQAVLSKLQLTQEHKLPIPVQSNISLARFLELGAKDPDLAWPVWQAFWKELQTPSSKAGDTEAASRPPVLFALDGADHIMRTSAYLNADAQPIHAHELALVDAFVGLLSGRTQLRNGGVVLAAVSESNRAAAPTLQLSLARQLASQAGRQPPAWDPYVAHDSRVQQALASVKVQKLAGLSKSEAKGVMEYYARSGVLRNAVTDSLVSEHWTLAGGGIIGQIERSSAKAAF